MNILVQIADHLVRISAISARLSAFFEQNFWTAPDTANGGPDLIIELEDGYGGPFAGYRVEITQEAGRIVYRRADYRIEADSDYGHAVVSVYDELALKHALINLYSAFLVKLRWGVIVHSSCAVSDGSAYMFAGHSGAGKSTAARLSSPRTLLSDEATLVKVTPEGIVVFDSPFRSELASERGTPSCRPLAGIHLLKQAAQNRKVRMTTPDAFFQLMDKVFYWHHDPKEAASILGLLKQVVCQVPVYELHFQKNNSFWELIS